MRPCSYAAAFKCCAAKGRLKNATGPMPWWRTVLKPEPEASQSMMNSLSKLGRCSTGAADRAAFSAEKALVAASV